MKRNSVLLYTLALAAVPAIGSAQSWITAAPTATTYYGGSLFRLENVSSSPIELTGLFDLNLSGTGATDRSYQVYTKPGPVSFATTGPGGPLTAESASGWTLFGSADGVTTNAAGTFTTIDVGNTLVLAPGSSVGIGVFFTTPGLTSTPTASGFVGYSSVAQTYTDGTLSISPGAAISYRGHTSSPALFGEMAFANRSFSGRVQYAPVPEPFSVAALGIGLVGFAARRRRSR